MKPLLAVLAVVITLLGYIPYFKDTVERKTKPHAFSWFTWGLSSLIAFGIQLTGNGGAGSYVNLAMAIGCFILAIYGLRDGLKYITKIDIISLVIALLAIVLWIVVKQPVLSILLVIVIDMFSFIPTVMKSLKRPFEETVTPYAASTVKSILIISALSTVSFTTAAYPAYSALSTLSFVIMLMILRSKKKYDHE